MINLTRKKNKNMIELKIEKVIQMKKNGYTIPELFVVIIVVGLIALVSITKVSYAFQEINNTEKQKEDVKLVVEEATQYYAKNKKEEFAKEEPSYIYAKEVAQAGYLFEKEEYNTMKVKITYNKTTETFLAEVID